MNKWFLRSFLVVFGMMWAVCLYAMEPAAKRPRIEYDAAPVVSGDVPILAEDLMPAYAWGNVFSFLPPADLGRVSGSCKLFKTVASNMYLDDLGGKLVKFGDFYTANEAIMLECLKKFSATEDELRNIRVDDFFERVALFFEFIVDVELWCSSHSIRLEMFKKVFSKICKRLMLYETFANSRYANVFTIQGYSYYYCIIYAAMKIDSSNAIDYIFRNFKAGVLGTEKIRIWLSEAIELNAVAVVEYLINVLNGMGVNIEEYLNSKKDDSDFYFLDCLLINEFIHDETLEVLIKNGARVNRILTGDNFMPVRQRYFRLLKNLEIEQ